MPYKLKDVLIELTKKCNLNCLHCTSSCSGAMPERELSVKEWVLVIDALARMDTKKVVFSRGEPTLVSGLGEKA